MTPAEQAERDRLAGEVSRLNESLWRSFNRPTPPQDDDKEWREYLAAADALASFDAAHKGEG